ncbi:MAG TPA: ATP synthase F1 subunit gamma [Saprospiraceae bacterium]|nr:ATP synthase F1 subunit gamma [Saprospiraceae bacterium]HRN33252.1 ATP synthase F1 subunit gamma [Saprospiraceae bacterium]HRP84266.1 ATP synthase F1 subunit gamma [Saprospiraceae bacterium]
MGANLKEVRERIKSVISTQQITKAMKMVSAAKLRRAQQAIVQLRPYSEKLNEMLSNILSNLDGDASSVYNAEREIKHVAIVIITSNRGLAGALNTNIGKEATALARTKYAEQLDANKVTFITIGKKGYDYVKRVHKGAPVITDYINAFSDLSFSNIAPIASTLMNDFATGKYDAIEISYSKFKNAGTQLFSAEQFLPVLKKPLNAMRGNMKADYIFEPDQKSLLEYLVPTILQTQFHKTLLDTNASEHGARMTAMDKATDNADTLLKELRINYNKARQEAITNELSEIVGGAAALNG